MRRVPIAVRPKRARLQFLQQGLASSIGRIEALGEPIVDRREHRTGFIAMALQWRATARGSSSRAIPIISNLVARSQRHSRHLAGPGVVDLNLTMSRQRRSTLEDWPNTATIG